MPRWIKTLCLVTLLFLPMMKGGEARESEPVMLEGEVFLDSEKPLENVVIELAMVDPSDKDRIYRYLARSDAEGKFYFKDLLPGSYTLKASVDLQNAEFQAIEDKTIVNPKLEKAKVNKRLLEEPVDLTPSSELKTEMDLVLVAGENQVRVDLTR